MFYLAWIPLLIVYYILYAYLSKRFNEGFTWTTFLWFYALNLLPIWVFVAKYSKNIIFDGLLYDVIMFVTFFGALTFLGSADKFSLSQWIGLIFVVIGFLFMKLG